MKKIIILVIIFLFFGSFNLQAEEFYSHFDFKRIFLKEIKKELKWVKGRIFLRDFKIQPENIKIPRYYGYQVKFMGVPKLGSNVVILKFYNEYGKLFTTVRLWGYIETRIPVVVITRPVSDKSILTEKDLKIETISVSRIPQDVIFDKAIAIGKQVRMSLKPGTILRFSHLEKPVIIKRNQEIYIVARGRNFIVRAKGIALQNGKKGEFIKVKNLSSKKILQAKVISEKEVEVNF